MHIIEERKVPYTLILLGIGIFPVGLTILFFPLPDFLVGRYNLGLAVVFGPMIAGLFMIIIGVKMLTWKKDNERIEQALNLPFKSVELKYASLILAAYSAIAIWFLIFPLSLENTPVASLNDKVRIALLASQAIASATAAALLLEKNRIGVIAGAAAGVLVAINYWHTLFMLDHSTAL